MIHFFAEVCKWARARREIPGSANETQYLAVERPGRIPPLFFIFEELGESLWRNGEDCQVRPEMRNPCKIGPVPPCVFTKCKNPMEITGIPHFPHSYPHSTAVDGKKN